MKRRVMECWRGVRFQPHVISVCAEGELFDFWVASLTGQQWYEVEDHSSWPEMAFIRDHLVRRGGFVVECGAHHGFTTILLAKWIGIEGKAIAFEASPENASIARKNVALNKLTNVEVHAQAVGSRTGKLWITDEPNAAAAGPLDRAGLEVPMVCLDDLFAGRPPDLVKIDVEGYELEVIRGMRSTLGRKAVNLAIEVHCDALRRYGSSPAELFENIRLEEYDCWLGIGDEAKEGIADFRIGREQVPVAPRLYLFALARAR